LGVVTDPIIQVGLIWRVKIFSVNKYYMRHSLEPQNSEGVVMVSEAKGLNK